MTKRKLDSKEKKGVLPELKDPNASLLGPAITSPSSSSSAFPWPTISSNFTIFCACSTLWTEEQQMLISYMRRSHCTHFRNGVQHPSGPRWLHDKMCAIPIFSLRADAILEFSYILDAYTVFLRGRQLAGVKKILQNPVHFTNTLSL